MPRRRKPSTRSTRSTRSIESVKQELDAAHAVLNLAAELIQKQTNLIQHLRNELKELSGQQPQQNRTAVDDEAVDDEVEQPNDNLEQSDDNDDQMTVLEGVVIGDTATTVEKDQYDNEFKHNYRRGNKIRVLNSNPDQFGVGPGTIGIVEHCTDFFVGFKTGKDIYSRRHFTNVELVSLS